MLRLILATLVYVASAACCSPLSMRTANLSPEHVAWIVETAPSTGPWVSSLENETAWVDAYLDGADHVILVARTPDLSHYVSVTCPDQPSTAVPEKERGAFRLALARFCYRVRWTDQSSILDVPDLLGSSIVLGASLFAYPWCKPILPGSLPQVARGPTRIRTAIPVRGTLTVEVERSQLFWPAKSRGDLHLRRPGSGD